MKIAFDQSVRERGLACARGIADWICNVQQPWVETSPRPGTIPFMVSDVGESFHAPSWNYAFGSMGLLGAFQAFGEERYKVSALRLGKVVKTFQVLDPFHEKHYGAIREHSALCPWCYTRDAISGAWGFVELYRFTGEQEYLERAKLFGEWLLRSGVDEEGYPWFGIQIDEPFSPEDVGHIKNDIQGNFQGGSLNYFYQLAKATGDDQWVGEPMRRIADIFIKYVQQESGFFLSVFRDTKKPVAADDPYAVLHRANDDLGTLGLLCAYHATGEQAYLDAVRKFLTAVWKGQREDGLFENSIAASAVVLNATHEAAGLVEVPTLTEEKYLRALDALLNAQKTVYRNPLVRGALVESVDKPDVVTMRGNCYALILLLKLFAGVDQYLTAKA